MASPPDAQLMPSSGPVSIQIDASLTCQLACPLCPTADGRLRPALGAGHLKLADFESLLERNPQVAHVELSKLSDRGGSTTDLPASPVGTVPSADSGTVQCQPQWIR